MPACQLQGQMAEAVHGSHVLIIGPGLKAARVQVLNLCAWTHTNKVLRGYQSVVSVSVVALNQMIAKV